MYEVEGAEEVGAPYEVGKVTSVGVTGERGPAEVEGEFAEEAESWRTGRVDNAETNDSAEGIGRSVPVESTGARVGRASSKPTVGDEVGGKSPEKDEVEMLE